MGYIVTVLVQSVEPVKFSSEVVGTNWVQKTEFSRFLKKRNATK